MQRGAGNVDTPAGRISRGATRTLLPVRLRPLLLSAALLAGSVALPALPAARAAAMSRPDACTLSFDAPTGDAPVFYVAPSDPDLDVTHVTWQVGPADVVVTARIGVLGDRPAAAWGDEFEAMVEDKVTGRRVSFGYFRTPSGGGPVFHGGTVRPPSAPAGYVWTAYPGGKTHVVADFDRARSEVVLTIPRDDLAVAFGVPFHKVVLTLFAVNTYAMDATYDPAMADFGHANLDPKTTSLAVADCDRWRTKRGPKAAAASPCALDLVAVTGDEASRTSDVVPTRDDSVDVARVSYQLTPSALLVTIRVARLTERPLFGTGRGYTATFGYKGAVVQFGVTLDAVDGTKARQYGGTTVTPLALTAVFDSARSTVTLGIPRAAVATAFGLKDTKSLLVVNPGATAFWTTNGTSAATADSDAVAQGRTLSFSACDKALKRK